MMVNDFKGAINTGYYVTFTKQHQSPRGKVTCGLLIKEGNSTAVFQTMSQVAKTSVFKASSPQQVGMLIKRCSTNKVQLH